MKRIIATVTQSGQVTLPAEVRRHLGVRARDKVAFTIEDGVVRVEPLKYQSIREALDSIRPLDQPLDWKEVERAVREERVARYMEKIKRGDA